jgi:hypothetical protein
MVKKPNISYLGAPEIQPPVQINISLYDDKGVAFKGYSKTLTNGNSYRLDKQTPLNISGFYKWVLNNITYPITRANYATKNFYCTDIVFNHNHNGHLPVDRADFLIISDGGISGDYRVELCEPVTDYFELILHFDVPILFSKGKQIVIYFGHPRIADEYSHWNFYGWEED